jgi:hypothetical protein
VRGAAKGRELGCGSALLALLLTGCDGGPTPATDSGHPADTDGRDTADTPAPPDADGDGYGDVAAGGDDCDDGDPRTNPGAAEQCDYADRDCDGAVYEAGVCDAPSDIWDVSWASWIAAEGTAELGRSLAVVGDLDGQGGADILVGCWGCEGATGDPYATTEIYLLNAPGGYMPPTDVEETARTRFLGDARYPGPYGGAGQADLDGDGELDLVYSGTNFVAVRYGPGIADGRAVLIDEDADAVWGEARSGTWSGTLVALGDVTGDGLPDFGSSDSGTSEDAVPGTLALLPGGDWRGAPDGGVADLHVLQFGDWRDCLASVGVLEAAGDFDGDGFADIATRNLRDACDSEQGGLLSVVSGAALTPGELVTVTRLDALDGWQWPDAPSFRRVVDGGPRDWDEDGYDDLLISGDRTGTYGALGVVPGGARAFGEQPEASLDDVVGAWHFSSIDWTNQCLLGGDLDGDEAPDIVCPGYSFLDELDEDGDRIERSHLTVIPGGYGPPVGLVDIAEVGVVLATGLESNNAWLKYAPAFGDVTGDGIDDLVSADPAGGWPDQPPKNSPGAVWVVPGWEIPWEEIWAERGVDGW